MGMKNLRYVALLLGVCLFHGLGYGGEVDAINFGWRFAKGARPKAAEPGFDDSGWQKVDLPHDWAISGPFDPDGDPDTAMLPWKGEGWYRKEFKLPAEAKGKRLQFVFDGVMSSPEVFLNGQKVGAWNYGYSSFWIDATDATKFGENNVLAVHADTREQASRWYPGAGIYRKVSMRVVEPVHIPVWGVCVTTPKVADDAAEVHAEIDFANATGRAASVGVEATLTGPNGELIAEKRLATELAGESGKGTLDFTVANPLRWDIGKPNLYKLTTRVVMAGKVLESRETSFGIREFRWTADDGFILNGRRVDLHGVCEHHTHGMLGAAFFPHAMERKLEILREMGINALRTSHNAEAPEVLEMCDRLGIVVINELFDKWDATAGKQVSPAKYVDQYAEAEVRNFVMRDRNHPSVMIWSISNEDWNILPNKDGKSAQHVAKVAGFFNHYDPTRPTIMVAHIPQGADREKHIFDAVDASGWNYSSRYNNFRKNYPEKPIVYTETASAFGTRGYYEARLPNSKTDYWPGPYQSNFGMTAAVWSDIPEYEFERMRKDTFLCGDFVWTGFDYLGEPTPARGKGKEDLGVKARSSFFGIVDLAGLPKDAYYLYRSHWRKDVHTVRVTPHWNWNAGDKVPVIVYTDGDEAELFLNGKSLGKKAKLDPDAIHSANLAFGKTCNATSSEVVQDERGNVTADHTPDKANDGNPQTRWCAEGAKLPQAWEVDLGEVREFSNVAISWESDARDYVFELLASSDGKTWRKLPTEGKMAREKFSISLGKTLARHLKVNVLKVKEGKWASINEFEVLDGDAVAQDPYYDIVDAYRIRFFDVPYETGELKAVAYKNGEKIGEHSVRTAGDAAKLDLQTDLSEINADGMDLCYVTVRMVDADGNLCPRAMDKLTFETTGPVVFMGVANGDQMGMESLTDKTHPLFFGQAVAVLRSKPGETGEATLSVTSENGLQSKTSLQLVAPRK